MRDSLLSSDDPYSIIKSGFEIMGHTGKGIVTRQDDIDLKKTAELIRSGNEESAFNVADLLFDLGLGHILKRDDIEDVLFGVQLGLESHRRKNMGGSHFSQAVNKALNDVITSVNAHSDLNLEIGSEVRIPYGDGLSKKVDFLIRSKDINHFGIEVNFYTASGSKPTEIKRSYAEIRRGLLEEGINLIWITDGKGYHKMKRSLRDAFVTFPNIYNLNQVRKHLSDDIVQLLS